MTHLKLLAVYFVINDSEAPYVMYMQHFVDITTNVQIFRVNFVLKTSIKVLKDRRDMYILFLISFEYKFLKGKFQFLKAFYQRCGNASLMLSNSMSRIAE